jgi:hypothetical protein
VNKIIFLCINFAEFREKNSGFCMSTLHHIVLTFLVKTPLWCFSLSMPVGKEVM